MGLQGIEEVALKKHLPDPAPGDWTFSWHASRLHDALFLTEYSDSNPGRGVDYGRAVLVLGSHIIFSALLQDRGKLPRLLLFEKVGILFLPMSILGALWGLAMGNDLAYIVSDTYKFAFFSIVFLATIMAVKPEKASRATSAILQLVLIGFAFELTSQLISLALEGPSRGLPIGTAFFLLPYLLAVEATGGHDPVFKTTRGLRALLLFAVFVSVLLSFSRSIWIASLLELVLVLPLVRNSVRIHMSVIEYVSGNITRTAMIINRNDITTTTTVDKRLRPSAT